MPKKIFELANEIGIGALDLVEKLKTQGFNVRNHMSSLTDAEVEKAISFLKVKIDKEKDGKAKKVAVKKVAKKAAIKLVKTDKQDKKEDKSALETEVGDSKQDLKAGAKETGLDPSTKVVTRRKSVIRRKAQDHSLYEENDLNEDQLPVFGDFSESLEEDEEMDSGVMLENKSELFKEEGFEAEGDLEEEVGSELTDGGEDDGTDSKKMGNEYPELRGLQVVFRPEEPTSVTEDSEETMQFTFDEKKKPDESGEKNSSVNSKEYFVEKMHSFTPIYTPPVVPKTTSAGDKNDKLSAENKEKEKLKLKEKPRIGVKPSDAPLTDLNKLDSLDKGDSKKRMGDLAAIMSKSAKVKPRDVIQLRADEELKSYSLGLIGKTIYTPPGKKKVYNGPSKSTRITEVKESKRVISVHQGSTALDFAQKLSIKFEELRDKVLDINLLVKPTDYFGLKLLSEVAAVFNYRVEDSAFKEEEVLHKKSEKKDEVQDQDEDQDQNQDQKTKKGSLPLRSPVVTVMGHVDHGKTTLLDYIRTAKVAAGEAGGITQHIGAYSVDVRGKMITFIDTPGHAAFSSMRERGATITDIVVLVVAADDGVMPQTKESIRLCQTAGVPIIVAVNKMDKSGINPDRVKQELMEFHLTPEEWGGDTQYVPISALKGDGVDDLLESINIQAEMMELRANTKAPAEGVVIEAKLETGRGPLVTLLIQSGTLKQGDSIVMGETFGRARSLLDASGNSIKKAGPSTPVQVLGLNNIPNPGDKLNVVRNEREAKKIVENRINRRKELDNTPIKKKVSLEDFFATQTAEGDKKLLKLIIRADVAGSYEAIKAALHRMGNNEVGVEIISGGTGPITETDVQMAISGKAYILGFNMRPVTSAQRIAEEKGVDIKTYRIIYELIDDIKLALEGLLDPDKVEKYIGRAEVRNTFSIPKIGTIAGSAVIDGKIERGCKIRLLRDGKIVYDGKLSTLKRFKDDVKEVKNGFECGISLENFDKVQVNDIFEAYIIEEKKRTLEAGLTL